MLIHRTQHPFGEQCVVLEWGTNRLTVDPVGAVRDLTGLHHLPRDWSVVSMAEGLHRAGHDIQYVYGPAWKWKRGVRPHRTPEHVTYIYWLYGFALGTGQWEQFVQAVRRFVQFPKKRNGRDLLLHEQLLLAARKRRFEVLEHTARLYYEKPWFREINPVFEYSPYRR